MFSIVGLSIAGGLLAIGILAIVISGVRGMAVGKTDLRKIGMILVPVIVFVVAYLLTNNFAEAGMATTLFLIALMAIAILFTGLKSTFTTNL
jgi:uncharacterized membrane protein YobD (UPF0266 family)